MPDYRRQVCRPNKGGCGRKAWECGPISWRGLCTECSHRNVHENCDALHTMTGPLVVRWRRGVAGSVGAVLLDDLPGGP